MIAVTKANFAIAEVRLGRGRRHWCCADDARRRAWRAMTSIAMVCDADLRRQAIIAGNHRELDSSPFSSAKLQFAGAGADFSFAARAFGQSKRNLVLLRQDRSLAVSPTAFYRPRPVGGAMRRSSAGDFRAEDVAVEHRRQQFFRRSLLGNNRTSAAMSLLAGLAPSSTRASTIK